MSSEAKLYELGHELELIHEELIENDGELTPELEQALNEVGMKFDEKVERIVCGIRIHQGRAKLPRMEIDRLEKLARPYERAAESMKRYVEMCMRQADVRKVDKPLGKAWLQKNSVDSVTYDGRWAPAKEPLDIVVEDIGSFDVGEYPMDVPPHLVKAKIRYDIDRDAILKRVSSGDAIPESVTVERGNHLRIK